MIEIGRLCIKTAGRDAGKKCAIIDILDDKFVIIDGETRRRKCNNLHLEPLEEKIDIKKGASHSEVIAAFSKINIKARETKPKTKTARPRKLRRSKLATKPAPEPKEKKAAKKQAPKKEKRPAKKTEQKAEKKEAAKE